MPQLPQCKRSLKIEMLRSICRQGSQSHRHSAWQDDFFFIFESFSCCHFLTNVSECRSCLLLVFYADVQSSMLCCLFSRTCQSYLGDGKYEGEEDGIKPETPHTNREHTRQAKYPNLTHLKMIMLIICRFWFGLLFFFS